LLDSQQHLLQVPLEKQSSLAERMNAAKPSTPAAIADIIPRGDTWGIILASLGVITVIISLLVQFSVIDNGSSNQLTVDAEVSKNIWGIFTGIILFVVGYVLWITFSSFKHKYLAIFLLAFSSYIVANFAVMLSLYQVQLTKV
jgi:hypothetical protein